MRDSVTVVGGGWSARAAVGYPLPGTIIGVNDSAIRLRRCDIALSMDRLWTEYRAEDLRARKMPAFIRRSAMKNVEAWPALKIFECGNELTVMSEHDGVLNGTNSGLCALNLAYQMRPSRIFLLGFDMSRGPNGEPYWYPPYPWSPGGATSPAKYAVWAAQFEPAAAACRAAGIDVFNVSAISAIDTFRRISPEQMSAMAS
jgi:hypothetical protein